MNNTLDNPNVVLAIDPGTHAGAVVRVGGKIVAVESWNHSTRAKTKKKMAEPKYFRLRKMYENIEMVSIKYGKINMILCEGALGFQKGKAAIEASHKFRAVVELYCALNDAMLNMIEPNDLKMYALGKRSGEKIEMVAAARRKGYAGSDDNEADAFLISCWHHEFTSRK